VIDSVYPLADIAAAHQAFERGGVVGKHVVTVPRNSL
jgi:NADPH:quinone reductase-like Zn-dependent oxidoreductase